MRHEAISFMMHVIGNSEIFVSSMQSVNYCLMNIYFFENVMGLLLCKNV